MPDNRADSATAELAALTRRTEAVEDRVEALQVQTGGNFAAVIEGQAALRREIRDGFDKTATAAELAALKTSVEEIRTGQARILELLTTHLIGRDPNA